MPQEGCRRERGECFGRAEAGMKRFNFRLESVRRLKAAQEEERKKAYGAAVRRYGEERERLHSLQERERGVGERLARELASGCPAAVLASIRDFLKGNAALIRTQEERAEEARRRMEEERLLLVEARKEHKAMEKLRERALSRHMYLNARAEQGFLDEVAGVRFLTADNRLTIKGGGREGED